MGGFALGLVAVFAASLGLGQVTGVPGTAATPVADAHTEHSLSGAAEPRSEADPVPAGLQVTEDGYRLAPVSTALATDAVRPFRFRVLGPDGAPVTRYTRSHDKDLHLIVVRRDLSGFQHVHPSLAADGTWSVPLRVAAAGQYRVFADFQPAGRSEGLTLGVDVPAPGEFRPVALPAAARTATVDGYTVTLGGQLTAGSSSKLTLSVSRNGKPVTDLQPYLGAYGHLVVLRDGDLAYLHVHPDGVPGDGRTPAGPQVTFYADVPTAGTYRLYLDFQHGGRVRTAEFTAVAASSGEGTAEPGPSGSAPAGTPSATAPPAASPSAVPPSAVSPSAADEHSHE
ncbi:hypothetical protein GCM10020369_53800 [Cryptosporangium minutisporangium]|uniref:Secreted protein n=1 Tax=Cryptosporangium minutisporangium TaxID=113569 RepID=A0ABP6T4W5_9ACTN